MLTVSGDGQNSYGHVLSIGAVSQRRWSKELDLGHEEEITGLLFSGKNL